RKRPIAKEDGGVLLNIETLRSGKSRREYRRQANERMKERIHPIVHNLPRRDDDLLLDAADVVRAEAIKHVAIFGHQRLHPMGVENVQPNDYATVVALLEDVSVAVR